MPIFRLTAGAVLVGRMAACSPSPQPAEVSPAGLPPPHTISAPSSFEFVARVATSHERRTPVHAALRIWNRADTTALLHRGKCSFGLRAYRLPQLDGRPVWDSVRQPIACEDIGYDPIIMYPHTYRDFRVDPLTDSILGDSLPAGEYFFSVTVRPKETPGTVREFAGGSALIRR